MSESFSDDKTLTAWRSMLSLNHILLFELTGGRSQDRHSWRTFDLSSADNSDDFSN